VAHLEALADSIRKVIPDLKWGSMLLWGQSLGRPGEDGRLLIGCEAINNCLRLRFEDDELLAVWNPQDVKITTKRFRIGSAENMRFTTYYQGRQRLPENILYRDYALQEGTIRFRTNEPWLESGIGYMPEGTAISFPAVEIIFDPNVSDSHTHESSPNIQ